MNSLAAAMMNTIGAGAAPIATDDTVLYGLRSTLDDNVYYFNVMINRNPTNGVVLQTFTQGIDHTVSPNRKIVFRKSTTNASTWGSKTDLYIPGGIFQVQDPSLGYDSNGRFHIMADCHDSVGTPGGNHELRYMYSDDDGTTVSAPVLITLPVTSLNSFRCYGRIIQMGSVLLCPLYYAADEGDTSASERYVLRSTDFGANWTPVLVSATGSTHFISEPEMLAITDDILIMVCRLESPAGFWQYKSEDKGLTWIDCGGMGFEILSVATPVRLHKFLLDDGTWCAELVYMKRSATLSVKAVYGRLNVGETAGIGIWKQTLYTLATDASFTLNYGDVYHYDNNMNAIGIYVRELNFPTDNSLIDFTCPTTHYGTVLLDVIPETIYDPLGLPAMIFDWRGLLANNTNDYGQVNSSSQVLSWRSIFPGTTSVNAIYSATAGGITIADGVVFDGTKALTAANKDHTKFMNYSSAGINDVNYTIYCMMKPGTGANPNAFYGAFGSTAGSAGNIGVAFWYDDRAAVPRSDAFGLAISKGSAGFCLEFVNNDVLDPNVYQLIRVQVDLSQSVTNDKAKLWVNGVLQSTTVTAFISTIAEVPTYLPQIGAVGNNAGFFIGGIKYLIGQNCIDIADVATYMENTLMDLEGL